MSQHILWAPSNHPITRLNSLCVLSLRITDSEIACLQRQCGSNLSHFASLCRNVNSIPLPEIPGGALDTTSSATLCNKQRVLRHGPAVCFLIKRSSFQSCRLGPSSRNMSAGKRKERSEAMQTGPMASSKTESLPSAFKKRKRKRKNLRKPSASASCPVPDDEQSADTVTLHRQSKRRKLTTKGSIATFSTSGSCKEANAVHSYVSDRCVLPSGPEGQGAAVSVANVDALTTNSSKRLPSRTANGSVRYRGRALQKDTRRDPSKPMPKAPKFLGIGFVISILVHCHDLTS